MSAISIALRRTFFLLMIAVAVGATASWWRRRTDTPVPAAAPEWPALRPVPDVPAAAPDSASTPAADAGDWVAPAPDGSAPASHPVKAKDSSGIFHVPGGRFYDRTKADRCYATAAAAEADGYRPSKT
jgi:hypothetical protein